MYVCVCTQCRSRNWYFLVRNGTTAGRGCRPVPARPSLHQRFCQQSAESHSGVCLCACICACCFHVKIKLESEDFDLLSWEFTHSSLFSQTAEIILRNNLHSAGIEMVLDPLLRERVRLPITITVNCTCRIFCPAPQHKPLLSVWSAWFGFDYMLCRDSVWLRAVPKKTWRTWRTQRARPAGTSHHQVEKLSTR